MQSFRLNKESRPFSAKTPLVLLLLLLLSGCGLLQSIGLLPKPPEIETPEIQLSQIPYEVSMTISGTPALNPDARGQASPIRLRLFLTEPDSDLATQPFETIFEFGGAEAPIKPAAVVVLAPGGSKSVTLKGVRSRSQLVVAAAFRDLYNAKWIETASIDTLNPGTITATVNENSVQIK